MSASPPVARAEVSTCSMQPDGLGEWVWPSSKSTGSCQSVAEQPQGVRQACAARRVDEGMRLLNSRLESEVDLLMATRDDELRGMSTRLSDLELAIAEKTCELAAAENHGKLLAAPTVQQTDDHRVAVGDKAGLPGEAGSRLEKLEAIVFALMRWQESFEARIESAAEVMSRIARLEADVLAVLQRHASFDARMEEFANLQDVMPSLSRLAAEGSAMTQRQELLEASIDLAADVRSACVPTLPDFKPAWACEQAIKLSKDVHDFGAATRLDQFTSVRASVEHLNGDDGLCPDGFCVVESASCGQPVLLWREDCRSHALACFGLENQGGAVCESSVPDVQQSGSGSWRCQAGILKAMSCTTS